MAPLGPAERRDMSELMEDRYGERSTILTSQRSPELWHDHKPSRNTPGTAALGGRWEAAGGGALEGPG